jgi:PAS domain S-box-containing protein
MSTTVDEAPNASLSIEDLPCAFVQLERDGRIRGASRRFLTLVGLDALPTEPLWAHAASAAAAHQLNAALQAIAPDTLTLEFARADGSAIHLEFEWLRMPPGAALVRDVTEQQSRSERLLELERVARQYRAIIDHNPEAVSVFDREGCFVERNAAAQEISGFSDAELKGRSFMELLVPEDRAAAGGIFARALQGAPARHELRLIARDGRVLVLDVVVVPVADAGVVTRVIAMTRDITGQREVEATLRHNQRLLDLFFGQSLDGCFFMMLDEPLRWDDGIDKEAALDYAFAHHRITRVNQAFLDQYGRSEADLLGLTPAAFFADREHGRQVWRDFFDRGRLRTITDELRADGTPISIEGDYICLYDEQGRITGHFGVQRDVTERLASAARLKASEARYRSLFENSLDGILLIAGEERAITAANPAACRILGYEEDGLIEGGLRLLTDFEDPAIAASLTECDRNGGFQGEVWMRHRDGRRLPIEVACGLIPGSGGGSNYHCAVFRDISGRKRAEQALEESYAKIRRLLASIASEREQEQQRIARDLHDELGQSLTVIKLDLAWLMRQFPDSALLRGKLEDAKVQAEASIEALRRLTGKLRPRALDDVGLAGACQSLLHEVAKTAGLEPRLRLSHQEFAFEPEAATAIYRIVQEALTNVARHANATWVSVSLEQDPGRFIVRVADDGRGFIPEQIAADSFGLLGMRERVRLLKGGLTVRSTPGEGTVLTATFPLPFAAPLAAERVIIAEGEG